MPIDTNYNYPNQNSSDLGLGSNDDLDQAKVELQRDLKIKEIRNEVITKEMENLSKIRF